MREFYKKNFYNEDKKKSRSKFFIFVLIANAFIIYIVLNKKWDEPKTYNIELISSKLTTLTAQNSLLGKKNIDKSDKFNYIISAEVVNKSKSDTFLFEGFIILDDTIYTQQKKFYLDSNIQKNIAIQFPKMKKLPPKRKYKIGIVEN